MVVVGGGEGFCVLGIFVAWDHCGVCFPRDPDRLNDNCNVNGLVWFGFDAGTSEGEKKRE